MINVLFLSALFLQLTGIRGQGDNEGGSQEGSLLVSGGRLSITSLCAAAEGSCFFPAAPAGEVQAGVRILRESPAAAAFALLKQRWRSKQDRVVLGSISSHKINH